MSPTTNLILRGIAIVFCILCGLVVANIVLFVLVGESLLFPGYYGSLSEGWMIFQVVIAVLLIAGCIVAIKILNGRMDDHLFESREREERGSSDPVVPAVIRGPGSEPPPPLPSKSPLPPPVAVESSSERTTRIESEAPPDRGIEGEVRKHGNPDPTASVKNGAENPGPASGSAPVVTPVPEKVVSQTTVRPENPNNGLIHLGWATLVIILLILGGLGWLKKEKAPKPFPKVTIHSSVAALNKDAKGKVALLEAKELNKAQGEIDFLPLAHSFTTTKNNEKFDVAVSFTPEGMLYYKSTETKGNPFPNNAFEQLDQRIDSAFKADWKPELCASGSLSNDLIKVSLSRCTDCPEPLLVEKAEPKKPEPPKVVAAAPKPKAKPVAKVNQAKDCTKPKASVNQPKKLHPGRDDTRPRKRIG